MPTIIVRIRGGIFAATAACALGACAWIPVTSDVNAPLLHTVQCRTFAWAGSFPGGPLSGTIANPLNEARLRAAIASHLQSEGMQPATSAADCLVGYGIGVRNDLEGVYPYGWGWGWGWGPWWGGGPYVYPEAIVGVDLYDARTRAPLWHAYAREDLSDLKGARAEQGIDAAIAAIFKKYPG